METVILWNVHCGLVCKGCQEGIKMWLVFTPATAEKMGKIGFWLIENSWEAVMMRVEVLITYCHCCNINSHLNERLLRKGDN